MVPPAMPKSLLVIGSGAIGIEFASFYRDMGAEVTVVEVLDRVLPVEDEEISAFAHKAFEKQGIKIQTSARREGAEEGRGQRHRDDRGRRQDAADHGGPRHLRRRHRRQRREYRPRGHRREGRSQARRRSTSGCRTGEPGIYAIGDVAGPPWLAHKASHEGVICVEKIAGRQRRASAGLSQHPRLHLLPAAGRQRRADRGEGEGGGPRGEGRQIPLHRQRQGDRDGRARGLVKTVFDAKTGELLGAHMSAPR